MACPELKGLRLSPKGQEALREIQRVKELADALATVMAAGMVVNIFAGSNALTSSYNIYEADWQELSQAMASIPNILGREYGALRLASLKFIILEMSINFGVP